MLELFDSLVDENGFKKVVSIDRRIEMRSKSELFPTRDPSQKNRIDKQNGDEIRYSQDGATVSPEIPIVRV
jgi:hypothetical protein